jgi:hypothetical protein
MLDNTITIDVNEDNDDGTTPAVEVVYSRFTEAENRSEYISADHTALNRDKLGFYRTFPKANGKYRGSEKTSMKITEDFDVPSTEVDVDITAPQIGEISFSSPVGLTSDQKKAFRMRFVALLSDDELMEKWHGSQQI